MAIAGLFLALPGLLIVAAYCLLSVVLTLDADADAAAISTFGLTFALLTLGAGGTALWHASRSLNNKASGVLRLPPIWAMIGVFGLCVALAGAISVYDIAAGLLFPPFFLFAAALPPLWAVSWFVGRQSEDAAGLTWRRGLVAFAGGATLGVLVAILLEILFPAIILSLVLDFANTAVRHVESLMRTLSNQQIAEALTHPGFIYVFVQLALIAPLAEEIAKPLVTLPLLKQLSRCEAFWIGAMAGAGFAALENVIYAGAGFSIWAGILVLRALGGAVHPLGAGLVALAWRDMLRGEAGAWRMLLRRFGVAAGMHALWNGGTLVVIALAGARFFGELPPEIEVLGLSAAGTTLALLIILGLGALWMGRSVLNVVAESETEAAPADVRFVLSDRAVAVWALACLVAILPAGVAGLKLLFW